MRVAFVSECESFSGILARALTSKYPVLEFDYYPSPQGLLNADPSTYQVLLFKLSNNERFDGQINALKKKNENWQIIGLTLGKGITTLKGRLQEFDFIFHDSEVENKLDAFFNEKSSKKANKTIQNELKINAIKRKYIQLDINRSRCLVLASQNKTSKEISIEMNKSVRTIEKYILYLRDYFGVEKKKDLIEVCRLIKAK